MATATKLTTEEFLARDWPRHTELVEGEVVVNGPSPYHQDIALELVTALRAWVRAGVGRGHASMSLDVRVDDNNLFVPDVLWIAEENWRGVRAKREPNIPALAVEVRSPSTWRYDVGAKWNAYEREGLPELWLVDHLAETVLVYRRSEATAPTFDVALELRRGEALTSPLLPGFALALDALFAPA